MERCCHGHLFIQVVSVAPEWNARACVYVVPWMSTWKPNSGLVSLPLPVYGGWTYVLTWPPASPCKSATTCSLGILLLPQYITSPPKVCCHLLSLSCHRLVSLCLSGPRAATTTQCLCSILASPICATSCPASVFLSTRSSSLCHQLCHHLSRYPCPPLPLSATNFYLHLIVTVPFPLC